jgi:hypothetical protein
MRHLKSGLAVIGAAVILVLAANTVSLAATGQALLLGKSNGANDITSISRTTSGSVLQLKSKYSSNPPLAVTGKGKVTNLNADTVDGYDSTSMRNTTRLFTEAVTVGTTSVTKVLPLPAGTYTVGYQAYMIDGGTAGGQAGCYFWRTRSGQPTTYYAETRIVTSASIIPGVSGSGVVTLIAGDTLTFYCFAPAAFTTGPNEPIQAYAQPTTVVSTTALRTSPSARRAH